MIETLILINLMAVLLLAAILSFYNTRQARALEAARSALEAWVMLQVKRHREAKQKEMLVGDPLVWIAAQVNDELDFPLAPIAVQRIVAEAQAVEVVAHDGRRVVVAPLNASRLRKASLPGKGRLAEALSAPLLDGQRSVVSVERSLLNAGDYFDLEAAQAGQLLNVSGWGEAKRLWFHILPPREAGH
jgi:hypothetical protein